MQSDFINKLFYPNKKGGLSSGCRGSVPRVIRFEVDSRICQNDSRNKFSSGGHKNAVFYYTFVAVTIVIYSYVIQKWLAKYALMQRGT